MASGYLTNSGADLDTLFYSSNTNAGALGYIDPMGRDLGNVYPSGSLGYKVGYANREGTDIGYLRSSVQAPTLASRSVKITRKYNSHNVSCSYTTSCCDTDGYNCYDCERSRSPGRLAYGYITVTGTAANFGSLDHPLYWDVYIKYWHNEAGYSHVWGWLFNVGSTDNPGRSGRCSFRTYTTDVNKESEQQYLVFDGSAGAANRSVNIGYLWEGQDHKGGNAHGTNYLRVYQRFRNFVGASPWAYTDVAM